MDSDATPVRVARCENEGCGGGGRTQARQTLLIKTVGAQFLALSLAAPGNGERYARRSETPAGDATAERNAEIRIALGVSDRRAQHGRAGVLEKAVFRL